MARLALIMIFLSLPPLFWLLVSLGLIGLLAIAFFKRLRWRPALALRGILMMLVLLGLMLPEKRAAVDPPPQREVLILDQSESLAPDQRAEARARAREWLAEGENRVVIVTGLDAVPVTAGEFPEADGAGTNLAEAIRQAAAYFGSKPGRLVLVTDGFTDDALHVRQAIDALEADTTGVRIETIPLATDLSPTDVFLGDMVLPQALWENTAFTVLLPVSTFLPGDITLEVTVNGNRVLQDTINLPAGTHLIPFNLRTAASEIMTITAAVEAIGDARPENNIRFAAVQVFDAPRVLIVTEDAVHAGAFANSLSTSGIDADLYLPEDLPDSLSALSIYQVILVDNLLASSFSEAQLRTLKDFVQQLGRGLVFSGGRNAYTLGGYKDTVIEPILPVRLDPPPREQDSPLTLVLVIDRSASMDGARGTPGALRPISLAREAALRSVETLGAEDFLGILSYNANAAWSLPLQQVGGGETLQNAKNAMAEITPSGGTAIFNALDTAVNELLAAETSDTRHIILLSDGNDETPLENYVALADFARENDISISTIALGVEADQTLMALLAETGQGRYYPVLQAADLPRILIDESRAARDENVREGLSQVLPGENAHPVLSGLDAGGFPVLRGYNALESKSDLGAEDILRSAGFEDPLLAAWQYGLGRVTAWTGDLGQEWAADWADWSDWGFFWANVIRYTLPDPALGPAEVDIRELGRSIEITSHVSSAAGIPQNDIPVSFAMVNANGDLIRYTMPQAGPGEYALRIPKPEPGAYRGVITYADEAGFPVEFAAPVVINAGPEWQPPISAEPLLFGELITWSALLPETAPAGPIQRSPSQALQRLLVLLILAWPIEIAIRRARLPWRAR